MGGVQCGAFTEVMAVWYFFFSALQTVMLVGEVFPIVVCDVLFCSSHVVGFCILDFSAKSVHLLVACFCQKCACSRTKSDQGN